MGVFILGLLIGALTPNFLVLVAARVMMGIGISMFPIAFSIIRDKFQPEKLAIGQGIFSSALSGGAVIGLIIGGGIVESYGWRAIFFIMLPVAAILFAIIAKFVHIKEIELQQSVSNKGSEFCYRFTHVRKDILLTENTNTFAVSDINIKGSVKQVFRHKRSTNTVNYNSLISYHASTFRNACHTKQFISNYLVFKRVIYLSYSICKNRKEIIFPID